MVANANASPLAPPADDTRRNTLDEVVEALENEGEASAARFIRRVFDHHEASHVCAMNDNECRDCGARS